MVLLERRHNQPEASDLLVLIAVTGNHKSHVAWSQRCALLNKLVRFTLTAGIENLAHG